MTVPLAPFNAQERDIDLMLLEEIHCSPSFLSWVAERASITGAFLVSARHSVYRADGPGSGETDVLVLIDTPDGRIALMIEDKIGAEMQPNQAKRYRERGEQLCKEGSAKRFFTLLCAPRGYLDGVRRDDWDKMLSFEEVAQWFHKQEGRYAEWRRDVLVRTIERQKKSSSAVSNETLANFKLAYWTYVTQAHPEFQFTRQPGGDKEYFFTASNFRPGIRLKHSFSNGSVVLVFEGNWKEQAKAILEGKLGVDLWIRIHDKTLDLVTGAEPIDLTKSVEEQEGLIDAAMESARSLLPYATMVIDAAKPT